MKKKTFAVFGLGKFGESVARELAQIGAEVLAIDVDEEKVHEIAPYVTRAMKVDVCDKETMESLGLSNMDGVIISITGNLDASIMAKSGEEIHSTILKKVGADKVIIPEKESGLRVARSLISGNFKEFIELSSTIRMIEIAAREDWVGKTLRELNLRKRLNINVIGIRDKNEIVMNLDPDIPIKKEYSFIVVLDKRDLPRLMKS